MRFEEAAIVLLAEQMNKTLLSVTLTDKQTGDVVPCTLNLPSAQQRETAG